MMLQILDDETVKRWLEIQARETFIPLAKKLREFTDSRYLEEKEPWGGEGVVELVPVPLLDGGEEVLTVRVVFRQNRDIEVSVTRDEDLVFSFTTPSYTVTRIIVRIGYIAADPRALVAGIETAKRIVQDQIEGLQKLRDAIEADPRVQELEEQIRARVVLEE